MNRLLFAARRFVALRHEALLCLGVAATEALLIAGLLAERRLVRVHDGYEYAMRQYYLLNGAVTAGEIPQWMPFATQGVVATWVYAGSTAILQHALYLVAPLLRPINFLPLWYLTVFVDELVLLAGVWWLARRFCASPVAVAFVGVTALGSAVWIDQPWLNFHFAYAVPLILALLHEWIERARWRYFFLAANLLALQTFSNAFYFLPATTFVIFVYLASWLVLDGTARRDVMRLGVGWPAAAALAGGIASLVVAVVVTMSGTTDMAVYAVGRDAAGATPLGDFLRYGGNIALSKWLELGLRVSPGVDYTLYVGIATLPFAVIGVARNVRRTNAHLVVTLVVTLLFAAGTWVSVGAYYAWPLMKYFRHIAMVSSVTKLMLCFVAGLGVDAVWRGAREGADAGRLAFLGRRLAVAMLALAAGLVGLVWNGGLERLKAIVDGPGRYGPLLGEAAIGAALIEAAGLASLVAVVLLGFTRARWRRPLAVASLALVALDLFTYKAAQSRINAFPLSEREHALLAFEPMPWVPRRCHAMPCGPNERFHRLRPWPIAPRTFYWTTAAYLYESELGASVRVDFWARPLDELIRAYSGQPVADKRSPPAGFRYWGPLAFPRSAAAEKLGGATEDKVQFFSTAVAAGDDEAVAARLRRPDFTGDAIFVQPGGDGIAASPVEAVTAGTATRLHLPYRVERFDANHLVVAVDAGSARGAWLMYSDVWHAGWRATVNDRPVAVSKANLAYKAVPLDPGPNRVHFSFALPGLASLQRLVTVNALAWLVALGVLFARLCAPRSPEAPGCGGDGARPGDASPRSGAVG